MNTSRVFAIITAVLAIAQDVHSEPAETIVARHLNYAFAPDSPQFTRLQGEAGAILSQNADAKSLIESEKTRLPVHDALFFATASTSQYDQSKFAARFPSLFEYGKVLLVSDKIFGSPRVVYQLVGTTGLMPRMIVGNGKSMAAAEYIVVKDWMDPEHLTEWIGGWKFEETENGPYLLSTFVGRETTGATSIRHVLGWVRLERDRLVPERFEAYDVPLGQARKPEHLKVVATPAKTVASGNVELNWRPFANTPSANAIDNSGADNTSGKVAQAPAKATTSDGRDRSPVSRPVWLAILGGTGFIFVFGIRVWRSHGRHNRSNRIQ